MEWQSEESTPKEFKLEEIYRLMDKVIYDNYVWQYIGHMLKDEHIIEITMIYPSVDFGWIKSPE